MPVEHEAPEEVIQALRQKVLDASTSLPAKYRALFALRNLKGPSAEAALICGRSLLPLPLYQVLSSHLVQFLAGSMLYAAYQDLMSATHDNLTFLYCWVKPCRMILRSFGMRWHIAWASVRTPQQ